MASKSEKAKVDVEIDGVKANQTIKQMESELRKLRAQIKKIPEGTKEFQKAAKDFQKLKKELDRVRDAAYKVSERYGAMKKLLGQALPFTVGGLIQKGVSSITSALQGWIEKQKEIDHALKGLQAITGASASDLKFYRHEAKQLGAEFGFMSKDIIEAYKLVGSAKPELLKNKEALASVTREAAALSRASGLELPDSVKMLTDSLNQFNAPASDAGKYANILAEAAKLGASEVPELTDGVLKSGSAARVANVSFAENAAILETFAEKGLKGAESGTQLRNVLLKTSTVKALPKEAIEQLEAAGVNLEVLGDNTLPLNTRLEELGKIQGNATAITKVFGVENFNAASILIDQRKRVAELSEALGKEGLTTVYEQAAIMSEDMNYQTERTAALLDKLASGEGRLSKFFASFVSSVNDILEAFSDWIDIPLSETLEEERMSLREVELQIIDANTSTDQRLKLIRELQSQYPDYLGNLDAETVTNDQLRKAIDGVNKMLVNKIILQEKDEEIENAAKNTAFETQRLLKVEKALRNNLTEAVEKYGITIRENQTLEEQANQVIAEARKKGYGGWFSSLSAVERSLSGLKAAQMGVNFREEKGNVLIKEKEELMARLGITMDETIEKEEQAIETQVKRHVMTTEEISQLKELRKEYEKFQEELLKIQKEAELAKRPLEEQDIARAEEKYEKLLDQAQKYYSSNLMDARAFQQARAVLQRLEEEEILKIKEEYDKIEDEAIQEELEKEEEKLKEKIALRKESQKEIQMLMLSEKDREIAAITDEYAEKIKKAKQFGLDTVELEKERNRQIDEVNKKYDDIQKERVVERFSQLLSLTEQLVDSAGQILEQNRQKQLDYLLRDLEKQKEAEIENAGQNAEEKDKIEKEYAKKEADAKREAFEREKKASITLAIIKGALAALNAFTIARDPISLAVLLGAAAIGTATNIALIKGQPTPEFFDGGFTKRSSSDSTPVGIVHANEYVVDAQSLRRPEVFQFARAIEARKKGFQGGGFTSEIRTTEKIIERDSGAQKLQLLMERVLDRLNSPIEASVKIGNKEASDIEELMVENEQVKNSSAV